MALDRPWKPPNRQMSTGTHSPQIDKCPPEPTAHKSTTHRNPQAPDYRAGKRKVGRAGGHISTGGRAGVLNTRGFVRLYWERPQARLNSRVFLCFGVVRFNFMLKKRRKVAKANFSDWDQKTDRKSKLYCLNFAHRMFVGFCEPNVCFNFTHRMFVEFRAPNVCRIVAHRMFRLVTVGKTQSKSRKYVWFSICFWIPVR